MLEKLYQSANGKNIAIVGLGGLGGYLASLVARLNPRSLLIIDGDTFSPSNLNRQLFAKYEYLGRSKAEVTKNALIGTTKARIDAVNEYLSSDNISILKNMDIILDATDNIKARMLLQQACNDFNIPLVHGAINGLFGEVAVVRPHTNLLSIIYKNKKEIPIMPTLSYVPANIATFQVSEMLKYFANENLLGESQFLIIDLLTNQVRVVNL